MKKKQDGSGENLERGDVKDKKENGNGHNLEGEVKDKQDGNGHPNIGK